MDSPTSAALYGKAARTFPRFFNNASRRRSHGKSLLSHLWSETRGQNRVVSFRGTVTPEPLGPVRTEAWRGSLAACFSWAGVNPHVDQNNQTQTPPEEKVSVH